MQNKFGIFFDLDGTLIDNEQLKAHAFAQAIQQLGGKSQPALYKEVMGLDGETIQNHFIAQAGQPIDRQVYKKRYMAIYTELLKTDLVIRPGARQFIQVAKAAGLHLAIVSSANAASVHYILNALAVRQYFDFVITGDHVTDKKPNPACYLLALDKMGLPKPQVMIVEDTAAGIQAAKRAGIQSIGIRHTYNQVHDFSDAKTVYQSFESDAVQIKETINAIFETNIF